MFIGETLLTKIHGVLTEVVVVNMSDEDVLVSYKEEFEDEEKTCYKKYWEVCKFTNFDLS